MFNSKGIHKQVKDKAIKGVQLESLKPNEREAAQRMIEQGLLSKVNGYLRWNGE